MASWGALRGQGSSSQQTAKQQKKTDSSATQNGSKKTGKAARQMQAAAGMAGADRLTANAAAAAAAAYYAGDYGAMPGTAGLAGPTASQLAAAATGAVSITRSEPSPMPLSSSPMHRDQFTQRTAGQAGTQQSLSILLYNKTMMMIHTCGPRPPQSSSTQANLSH